MLAQPHPNGGATPGGGNSPVGGAPVGDGIYILIAMALVYGISRWYAMHKQKTAQE